MDEMDLRLPIFILPKSQYSKQKNTVTTELDTVKERKIKKDKKKIGLLKKAEKINEKTDEPAEN